MDICLTEQPQNLHGIRLSSRVDVFRWQTIENDLHKMGKFVNQQINE